MKLIVGLGNPGKRYEKTRHNVGFFVLDKLHDTLLSSDINAWELSKKFNAHISGCTRNGEKIILVKPLTFMNRSGDSVGLIAHYYKITHDDIIIVHDDKDIQLGDIKIHKDRGHAGHNGIKSIIEHIGTRDFLRIRIGIKSTHERKMKNTAKFVLSKFGVFEKRKLLQAIDRSVEEILTLI